MAKLRMLEMGGGRHGARGIAFTSRPGNHYRPFSIAHLHAKLISTAAQNALRTSAADLKVLHGLSRVRNRTFKIEKRHWSHEFLLVPFCFPKFVQEEAPQGFTNFGKRALGPCRLHQFCRQPSRAKHRRSVRRLAAWLVARASDPKAGLWLVIGFAATHAVLWTLILINLKAAQDVHMDVAEAFAWGQKFQFGYGKHPPLSGWVAGLWFKLFPVADWATYALAMTVVGCGIVISWLTALHVVDRRRAFLVVGDARALSNLQLQGFKYNPDLLQLVTLPLVRAGLSVRVRETRRAIRPVAWPCRRRGADDENTGC